MTVSEENVVTLTQVELLVHIRVSLRRDPSLALGPVTKVIWALLLNLQEAVK